MNLKVKPFNQFDRDKAIRIFKAHPEFYDKFNVHRDYKHLFACQMYEVYNEKKEVVGMFGLNYFYRKHEPQIILANVYVCRKYRKMGVFNAMVEYAKNKTKEFIKENEENCNLYISCVKGNDRANAIYRKLFTFRGYDEESKLNWYEIC